MRRPAARRAQRAARAMGLLAVAALLGTAACTTAPETTPTTTTGTATPTVTSTSATPAPLVVETVFDHSTLDPTRQYDRSGALLSKALYETLTTYDGADQTKPQAGLAEYTMSPEGKWLTLRLRSGRTFSDGTPVTSDDVVFTLERVKGLRGAAASMLGNVTARKVDDRTLTLTSPDANFALPAMLANPAFGILNSRVVKANGGAIGPGDTADTWLSTHSAGSGPYVLSGADATEVRLTVSPTWTGAQPAFPEVVVRDADPGRQVSDLTSGKADVALDLSPAQADRIAAAATGAGSGSGTSTATPGAVAAAAGTPTPTPGSTSPATSPLSVMAALSSTTAFLMLHRDPTVNAWTANADFAEAVRLGIDRQAVSTAVRDAIPAAGVIPVGIVGSLLAPTGTAPGTETVPPTLPTTTSASAPPTTEPGPDGTTPTPGATATAAPEPVVPQRDLAGARAALARSGYKGQPIPLTFARDLPIQGVPTASVAAIIKTQLASVGITVVPTPLPAAQALERYRAGRDAFSLWSWNPDYTDPENYLAFAPGGLVGQRAGWAVGADADIDTLADAARSSVGDDRPAAYAAWQRALNTSGPFVPLFQPSSHLAHGPRVTELPTNPVWTLDLAGVS
ncbi:peptide/nickel transport system substrate-binding protein [Humibacillus xanthopallidus]|uniref:Peptide/nickel transport system substrate-binding protein n=1 Tax=Humibacillus xanthopallidus TaxID=412689 RepID=A0A543PKL0_9MICO|nr:ABC transporter substrate-binding protein [Humibacillus xanthopallidus]TQN44615.1 peptide/nickel transport system substrate-binding protein [Humibacillus xanthopallidus]